MESIGRKYGDLSLRKAFVFTVLITFCGVVIVSAGSIWGCMAFRKYLLPESNKVWVDLEVTDMEGKVTSMGSLIKLGEEVTSMNGLIKLGNDEMTNIPIMLAEADGKPVMSYYDLSSIQVAAVKVENRFESLTPKRKLAYQASGIMMIALPLFFSMTGILFCGFFFYRYKLSEPLKLLSDATEQIASENLDFTLSYVNKDEMGRLCQSFEQMRQVLDENNRTLWKMLEERKLLQASIAHDLRNPIAIISGYAEYMQMNLPKETFTKERIAGIADHIHLSARRLEKYTDSMKAVNQLEDMEIEKKSVSVMKFAGSVAEDFTVMAAGQSLRLEFHNELPDCVVQLDSDMVYRMLENIINNALRFAREEITLTFLLEKDMLCIFVCDDGEGFSEEILRNRNHLLTPTIDREEHCGLGLMISRLLVRKHGGRLELSNRQMGGAEVKIFISV